MKRLITLVICTCMITGVVYKLDYISDYAKQFFNSTPQISIEEKNKYSKSKDYEYVQISENFIPYNFQELLNVFYTVLDSGYETFTFYCPVEYEDCIKDVEKVSDAANIEILTTIGNYVSPFNNFSSLKVQYDTAGEVTINITRLYSDEDIATVNQKLDVIWNDIIKQDMEPEEIIYAFHDYIINNTKYDEYYEEELKTGKTTHQANKANGLLFEGYAICSGYTDTLALVLDRLNIPNFKVASDTHVWNVVYIDGAWKHIDLTWDDPVSEDHSQNNLLHKFFLIDTTTLHNFDIKDHNYNTSLYLELK